MRICGCPSCTLRRRGMLLASLNGARATILCGWFQAVQFRALSFSSSVARSYHDYVEAVGPSSRSS